MGIFKAYDIRGIYPEEINEDIAYKIGKAFVEFLSAKDIAIGKDMRNSSEKLYDKLSQGITDQGANVHFLGLCTTPMLNFSVVDFKADGGIMISASHNPGQYNAFKLIKNPTIQIHSGNGIEKIKSLVERDNFNEVEEKGKIFKVDPLDKYLDHISKFSNFEDLNIVIDYGNGVGAVSAKPFFKNKQVKVKSLYETPDGNFPNHPANPHELENFSDLQEAIKKGSADLGIFFDGDADRAIFVDEKGDIIPPDFSFCLQALEELKENSGGTVYHDLRFSKIVREKIEEIGGNAVMERVGNPFYKELLIGTGGVIAGELSGHVMYKQNYSIDDGLFSCVKFLNIVSKAKKSGKTVSQLIEPLEKYVQTPEINIEVEDKDKVMDNIKKIYSDKGFKILEIDGITVEGNQFWFNIRKSNTEPLLRLRIEADNESILSEIKEEVVRIINSS